MYFFHLIFSTRDKYNELDIKTPTGASKDSSENDTNTIPDLSSSTFFGVRLKSSRKTPASPDGSEMFSFKPQQNPKKTEAITKQTVELKADLNKLLNVKTSSPEGSKNEPKNDIAQHKRAQGPPPPPPERIESLKDASESRPKGGLNGNLPTIPIPKKKSPPSFKPPPPPVRTTGIDKPAPEDSDRDIKTRKAENASGFTTFLPAKNSEISSSEEIKPTPSVADTLTDSINKEQSIITPITNETHPLGTSDRTVSESQTANTETKQTAGNDGNVELRNKPDFTDVDTSGVEMRRSRRNTRNGSINKSWARSKTSTDLEGDKPDIPTVKVETVEETSDELSDLEKIIGPLLAGQTNGFQEDSDHTAEDVTMESDAFIRLRTYFENNSEHPFDLSLHKVTTNNSVQLLRNYLSV